MNDAFIIGVVLLVALPLAARFCRHHLIPDNIFHGMVIIHIVTTVFFHSMPGANDWELYYNQGNFLAKMNSDIEYARYGVWFIVAISHAIQSVVDISTAGMFAIFSSIGFFGILFVAASVRHWLTPNRFDVRYFLLLPGIHLWTSALGKDSLMFFALSAILLSVSRKKILTPQNGLALALIFMIRPHVALMLIISASAASVLCRDGINTKVRTLISVVSLLAIAVLLPTVMRYMGVSAENAIESVNSRIESAAMSNQTGGGAVDITKYSPPLRLFTYLFRPLFFDIRNLMGWPASMENAVLLTCCVLALRHGLVRFLISVRYFEIWFAIVFVSLMSFVLGMTTANLGLALRQKTQLLPFLYYVLVVFRFSKVYGLGATRRRLDSGLKRPLRIPATGKLRPYGPRPPATF